MKITSVDIIRLKRVDEAASTPVLCRINTDEGIYGYGEAGVSIMDYSVGCLELLKSFSHMIIGDDPLATDVIYQKLIQTFWAMGNGGVIMAAISAIDTALWDIKGKYFGVPVYQLLGGAHRKKLRCYASQLQNGWSYRDFLHAPGDLNFLKEACLRALDDGYDCIKIDFLAKHLDGRPISGEEQRNHLSVSTMKEIDARLQVVRDTVGEDIELILENHCLTTARTALQFAHLAEQYHPILLEEPANPLEEDEYRRLREGTSIPLATGERSYTRRGFLPLIRNGLVDVIQPDLGNCGGLTEGRKICDLADSFSIPVQTHTCNTPISVAASLQFEAAIPNFYIHEHHTNNTISFYTDLCVKDLQPDNGYYEVPDTPGIGNELSEKALASAQILTVK